MTMSPKQRIELHKVALDLFDLAEKVENPVEKQATTRLGNAVMLLANEPLGSFKINVLLEDLYKQVPGV